MKEIVIISGKGGTGKTSIAASYAMLGNSNIVVADCDVDAADMHLLLEPDFNFSEDFYSGELAYIDSEKCISCNICVDVCRFAAIKQTANRYEVNIINCEGCGYCSHICAAKAIDMKAQNIGKIYISNVKTGAKMVHARLGIGAENSGKLVAKVKKEAAKIAKIDNLDFLLVDGSPGVGCPVVSSLSGASYAILVTEPTVSGLHDLVRIHELVKRFNIKSGCIINKFDINETVSKRIEEFLKKEGITHLANFPYNENFSKAMTLGKTIIEYDDKELKDLVVESWQKILENVR